MNNKKWYAIYTKPRAEKKVKEQLEKYNYLTYLPLKLEYRQWKDRIKKIEVPLFRSYVFVKITEKEYYEILKRNIQGIVKFVTIGGKKVTVREEEIKAIKKLIAYSEGQVETTDEKFEKGETVEIKYGGLKGLKGTIVELRGKHKLVVRIDSLYTNLLVEVTKKFLKK